MKNRIGFRFFVFVFLFIVFILNGCAKKEISPEIRDTMNKNGLTSEQICKGNNIFIVNRNGKIICNDWISIEQRHIKLGLEFKKFETYCAKINGRMELGSILIKNSDNRYGSENYISKDNVLYCNINSKKYIYNDYEDMNRLYEQGEEDEKISLKKNKMESEKMAQLKDVQSRLRTLGLTEKNIRDRVNVETIVTHHNIDLYLKFKEKEKQEEEYEKSLKIKNGNQYICTDGYDSWVLKYNGSMIIFGDRTFRKNLVFDFYERYRGDTNPIIIDRENAILIYLGNKSTCRPR